MALFSWSATLAVLFAMLVAVPAEAKKRLETLSIATGGGEVVIEIEVAATPDEQARGLMFRTSVPERTGMLFPYSPAREITMWMRNTYVSLDMIFIRADGVIHRIETHTEPMSERVISSGAPATGVLEIAAGSAARLGIKPGDTVRHGHFGTAAK
jgi:uncharacterized membrane protein (UPF0127 family)